MKCLFLLYLFVFRLLLQVFPQVVVEDRRCEIIDMPATQAYIGWPFSLTCAVFKDKNNYIRDSFKRGKNSGVDTEEFLCEILLSNGTTLLNSTITNEEDLTDLSTLLHPEPQEPTFKMKFVEVNSSKCWTVDFTLKLIEFPQQTCQRYSNRRLLSLRIPLGSHINNPCISLDSRDIPVANDPSFTYKWERNCSDTLPENVSVSLQNKLVIPTVSFEHAGVYTCSVTYNGMTRYTSFYEMCVHQPFTFNQHTFTCSNVDLYKNENEDAVFECVGNFGERQVSKRDVEFYWKKKGEKEDTFCDTEENSNEHSHCTITFGEICFFYNPSDIDKQRSPAKVPLRLTIRNISESDFGEYIISAKTFNENSITVNRTVELKREVIPGLMSTAAIVAICCGTLLIILILMIFIIYNFIYLKVLYKIYFGKYESDDKDYGACLLYNFCSDHSKFVKEDVKSAVKTIRKILERKGYNVLDGHQNYTNASTVDILKDSMERSHRIVIFLTSEFIKDEDSLFQLYEGFIEMIESSSRLIFVLLPGMKEYLKQHQQNDKDTDLKNTCLVINRAMALNHFVAWTGERDAERKRFLFQLEAAMPKLRMKNEEEDMLEIQQKVWKS